MIGGLIVALLTTLTSITAYAADSNDLQHYMGLKTKYVWREPAPQTASNGSAQAVSGSTQAVSGNTQAGNVAVGAAGYTFTTKDSSELVAQAVSSNHPAVTEGFIRQVPMRDLIKVLATVKSAASILAERKRDDLLAKAYIGGYVAPEHTVIAPDAKGKVGTVPVQKGSVTKSTPPIWASNGDIGQVGVNMAVPMEGRINLLSVFGESYVIGSNTYDLSEVVFDTTKNNKVLALFNGYVSYVGQNVLELMSYDQQVTVRYRGVQGLDGTVAGSVFSQGTQLGTTSDFSLGVSLRIGTIQRNLLQVYPETLSKGWFTIWSTKYPTRATQLVLNAGDANYHITASELQTNQASSYINPEAFGVNPKPAGK